MLIDFHQALFEVMPIWPCLREETLAASIRSAEVIGEQLAEYDIDEAASTLDDSTDGA
eukprot:gene44151-16617_t